MKKKKKNKIWKKGPSIPWRGSTISPARVFRGKLKRNNGLARGGRNPIIHILWDLHTRGRVPPSSRLLPARRSEGKDARVRDSTAKVISRFIGSDIYYRWVYFYCVPVPEFLFSPSSFPRHPPFNPLSVPLDRFLFLRPFPRTLSFE